MSNEFVTDERGVSELVGTILIIGVVLAISIVVIGAGIFALQATLTDTNENLARQSLVGLDDKMTELSESETESSTTFEVPQDTANQMDARNEDFQVEFQVKTTDDYWTITDPNGELVRASSQSASETQTYGTIVHEGEDGTLTAYQGGAIWEKQDGNVQMVSEPNMDISDGNLELNFVDLSDVELVQEGNELQLTKDPDESSARTEEILKLADERIEDDDGDPVSEVEVTMVIETEFAPGWAEYAESLDGVDSSDISLGPDNESVTVDLGTFGDGLENVPESPNFDKNVIYSGPAEFAPILHDDNYTVDTISPGQPGFRVDDPSDHWDDYKVGMLYNHDEPDTGDLDWWVYNGSHWVNQEDPNAEALDPTEPTPVSGVNGVSVGNDEFKIEDPHWVCAVENTSSNPEFRNYINESGSGCLEQPIDIENPENYTADFEPRFEITDFNTTAINDGTVVAESNSPPKRLATESHKVHVNVSVKNTGTGNGTQPIGIVRTHEDPGIQQWVTAGNRTRINYTNDTATWVNRTMNFSVKGENGVYAATPGSNSTTHTYMVTRNVSDAFFEVNNVNVKNDPITAGDKLKVDVTVENTKTGGEEANRTVVLQQNGTVVTGEEYENLGPSDPPETKTFVWNTTDGDGDSDLQNITITTGDDSETAQADIMPATSEPEYEVTSVSSNSPVEEGDELTVTADIENVGTGSGSQDVVLWKGDQVLDVEDVNENAGSVTTIQLDWQTAIGDRGQNISLEVRTEDDSESLEADVEQPGVDQNFTITQMNPDKNTIDVGEDINVDVTVENTGSDPGTQDIRLYDTKDNIKDWEPDVNLNSSESKSFTLTWSTAIGDGDSGNISVRSRQDNENRPVIVQGSNFEPPAFDVAIDSTNASVSSGDSVKVGEPVTVDMTVENVGSTPDEKTVLIEDFSGAPVNATDVFLNGGESKTVTLSWFTAGVNATGNATGDVTATVDGNASSEEVKIIPREVRREPLDVAFVIDESGSMWWNDPDEKRETAIKSAVGGLNESKGDRASLTQFDGWPWTYQEMTDDLDEVNSSIQTNPGGGTYIKKALNEGQAELNRAASERSGPHNKVIILLSDGEASKSSQEATNWAQNNQNADITLYTVGFGDPDEEDLTDAANLAGTGEGEYREGANAGELDEIFADIIEKVTEVDPPNMQITDVSVASDPVTEPDPIEVTATIKNTGDGLGDQPVMLVDSDGRPVASDVVNVTSGNSETVTFTWETKAIVDWQNETGDTAPVQFSVETPDDTQSDQVTLKKGAQDNFTVNNVSATDPVQAGDSITFDVELENTGAADGSQPVTVYDQNRNPLTSQAVSLNSSESKSVSLTWATGLYDDDVDNVTIETDNDAQDKNVTIEPADSTTSEFDVEVLDSNANETEGESIVAGGTTDLVATVKVENTGNASAAQAVVLEDEFGNVRASDTITLDAGDDTEVDILWSTQSGDYQTDVIEVSSKNDNDTHAVDITENVGGDSEFNVTNVTSNADNSTGMDKSINLANGTALRTNITIKNEGDLGKQIVRLQDPTTDNLLPGSVTTEVDIGAGETKNVYINWSSAEADYDKVTVATNDDKVNHPVNITRQSDPNLVELDIDPAQTNATSAGDVISAGDGNVTVEVEVIDADGPFTLSLKHSRYGTLALNESVTESDSPVYLTWETKPTQGDIDAQTITADARGSNEPTVDVFVEPPDDLDPSEADVGDDGNGVNIDIDDIKAS